MTDTLLGVSVVFIQTLSCLQLNGVPLTCFCRLFIFAASLESVTRLQLTQPDIPRFYRFRSLYPVYFLILALVPCLRYQITIFVSVLALPDCQCSLSLLALLSRIYSQFKRGSVTRYSKELSRVVIDYPNSLYSLTASVDFFSSYPNTYPPFFFLCHEIMIRYLKDRLATFYSVGLIILLLRVHNAIFSSFLFGTSFPFRSVVDWILP